uniref:RING-type E3 ubiquitin transferase n=1 Tax=Panagrellus redivivus TaxID=6233 RepID=A0A7E4VGA6_PANRE
MANLILGPTISDTVTGGRTLKLSAYDRVRKPHEAITDPKVVISIGPRTLSNELDCPVCLDLLNKTTVTKTCLHRFCSDCIVSALQHANKECPTCRTKLISKRGTRADNNFDRLIKTVWADRGVYDRMQKPAAVIKQGLVSLQESIQAGIKAQAANRRQRVTNSYALGGRRRKRPADGDDDEAEEPEEHDPGSVYDFPSEGSEEPEEMSSSAVSSDSSMLDFEDSDVSLDSNSRPNEAAILEARADLRLPPGVKAIIERAHSIIKQSINGRIPRNLYDTSTTIPDEKKKIGSLIEVEAIPTISLMTRHGLPASAVLNHYLRLSSDVPIGVLARFLPANIESMMIANGLSKEEAAKARYEIKCMFVVTPGNLMHPLGQFDTIKTAYNLSTNTSEHLLIFFDSEDYHPMA